MAKSTQLVGASGSGSVQILYNPYQDAFLQALAARLPNGNRMYSRLALFAGRRAGKTLIGAVGTVAEALRYPNQTIWACSGSYPKLHDYVIPAIAAVLSPSFLAKPYSAGRYEWTLRNGTVIHARSLDDPNRARGPGLNLAWIDEARDVAIQAFNVLAPALDDKGGAAVITTTPNGFDPWYRSFWKRALDQVPGYWACKYNTEDNPHMRQNRREELDAAKRDLDPLFYQQEYMAEFVSFTGAIYGDALVGQILETDDDVRRLIPEWPRVNPERVTLAAIDPGTDHPFAFVLLVATEFGLVVVGEYLARNAAAIQHARAIWGLFEQYRVPPPSTFAIDRSAKQAAIELAQHGLFCVGAENEVMAGIQRVKSWLLGRRLWFVRSRCPKLLEQLYSYRFAENTDSHGQYRRETVVKIDDDLPDALRYALMSWPELPYAAAPSLLPSLDAVPEPQRWAMARMQRADHPECFDDEDDDTDLQRLDDGQRASTEADEAPLGNFWG